MEFEQRDYDFERPLTEIDFIGFKPRALHNDALQVGEEVNGQAGSSLIEITKTLNTQTPEKLSISQRTELASAFVKAAECSTEKTSELLTIAENLAPMLSYAKARAMQTAVTRKIKSLNSTSASSHRHALTEILNTGESARNFARNHLGEHHPACFLFCIETSDLCWELAEKSATAKQSKDKNVNTLPLEALQYALTYRQEALALAVKVLGRLHKVTKELVVSLGSINKALGNYAEAIGFFLEALKTNNGSARPGWLLLQAAECHRLKGDNEEALEYTLKAKSVLENGDEGETQLDDCLQQIAELAKDIYPGNVDQEHTEVLGKEAREVLDQAGDAYEALFERLRSRPDSIDGDSLIRILKRLISLKIRLAAPAERTVIHAIRTSNRESEVVRQEDDVRCKDMLVRMVTINSASQHISRILEQGTAVFDRKLLQSRNAQLLPAVEDLRTLVLIADTPN